LEHPDLDGLEGPKLDGFIGPAHVSAVIGSDAFAEFAETFKKPVVVAGFEPLDVMQSILMLIHQVNDGRHVVENQYVRAVTGEGNRIAQAEVAKYFELREDFEWRGFGRVPASGLRLRKEFAAFDAELRFGLAEISAADNPACECGTILRGIKRPNDCKLFGTLCTPETPMGSCMVSSEGACAAHWTYGRFRDHAKRAVA
jgi:hydrogenase expression/formation protein HypD